MVYKTASEIGFSLADCAAMPRPGRVLFVSPDFFDVTYVINPHMTGHIGTIDKPAARKQWTTLRNAYETLGIQPSTLVGGEGLPDMVFCANQTLPYYRPDNGRKGVIASRMYAAERRDEVALVTAFFRSLQHEVLSSPASGDFSFEGMGDAIWHPSRYLLWGGYGFRTSESAYQGISDLLDAPVLILELNDPDFYHLDTCFSVLDENTVLVYPGAFEPAGLELIRRLFARVIEAPEDESRRLFACNAHCPDGKNVLIQKGCVETNRLLTEAGYQPIELDTSEFLKSGGSVFCMKLMFW